MRVPPERSVLIPYSTHIVPSTFPASQRPIIIYPIADVTKDNKEVAYEQLVRGINILSLRHKEDRTLVHTVSFDLTDYLHRHLGGYIQGRLLSYRSAAQRQRAIDAYIYTPRSILLAASLERGIDLPNDDCRAIIVAKVPYPYLGDKQVNARLHSPGGQLWYGVQTVRSLVQMTGRGMRHAEDYCKTYILDRQFINLWNKNKSLFPDWWTEAIDWHAGRLI